MCPKLTRLAELVFTIPVSNAWPERGASKVKIIGIIVFNLLKLYYKRLHSAIHSSKDVSSSE
jgi:hypothetical protein